VVTVVIIVTISKVKKEEDDFMGTTSSKEVNKLMKDRLKVIGFLVNKIVKSMMETTQNYFHNSEFQVFSSEEEGARTPHK